MRCRRLQLVLLVAVATATFSSAAVLSRAAPDTHLGRAVRSSILFSNSLAIYRRDPGGALTQLAKATGTDFDLYPVWSRSGTRIAFERGRPPGAPRPGCSLMVMNSDGSGLHRVGQVKTDCSGASWGPNDEQLVFGSGPPVVALRIVNEDGTGLRTLLRRRDRYGNPEETGTDPAWSPDGRTIVFSWSLGPVAGLDAIRPNGSHLRALVRPRIHRGGVYGQPSWSRDGKRLAFVYYDSLARTRTITVSTSTGLRRHALTGLLDHPTPPGGWGGPSWSPDDSLLVFSGVCGVMNGCVWTIPSRGGKRQLLEDGAWLQPSWGPAGT